VTDCLNGGVKTGIEFITKHEYHNSHTLLWAAHSDTTETLNGPSEKLNLQIPWGVGFFNRVMTLRKVVKEIKPDFVHAHSSYAGLLTRIFCKPKNIIYSPHCFAFERMDVSWLTRSLFYVAEFLLSFRTGTFLCNWPNEFIVAETFSRFSKSKVKLVPIFDLENLSIVAYQEKTLLNLKFGNVGRIRPQKDPMFFVSLVRNLREQNFTSEWSWMGVGDLDLGEALLREGVEVIPWSEGDVKNRYYEGLTCLVITSAWESGPLTLVESLVAGTPVILRTNSSSEAFGMPDGASPNQLASRIKHYCADKFKLKALFYENRNSIIRTFNELGSDSNFYLER